MTEDQLDEAGPAAKSHHPARRFLVVTAAFGAGICAGVFLPVLIAGVLGYGTGSYEDVMFIWLLTVPGCVALSCTAAWRWSAPKAARPEVQ